MRSFLISWISTTMGVMLGMLWMGGDFFMLPGAALIGLAFTLLAKFLNLFLNLRDNMRDFSSQPQPPPRPGEMKPVEGRVIEADER